MGSIWPFLGDIWLVSSSGLRTCLKAEGSKIRLREVIKRDINNKPAYIFLMTIDDPGVSYISNILLVIVLLPSFPSVKTVGSVVEHVFRRITCRTEVCRGKYALHFVEWGGRLEMACQCARFLYLIISLARCAVATSYSPCIATIIPWHHLSLGTFQGTLVRDLIYDDDSSVGWLIGILMNQMLTGL